MADTTPGFGSLPPQAVPWARSVEERLRGESRTSRIVQSEVSNLVAAQNSTQGSLSDTVATVEVVQRVPETPVLLGAVAEGGWNSEGAPVAQVALQWDHVALGTDGEPVNVTNYEVWNGGNLVASTVTPSFVPVDPEDPESPLDTLITFVVQGFPVEATLNLSVRARSDQGVWSALSNVLELTTPSPVGGLETPSDPVSSSGLGAITLSWDGLLGGEIPPKYFSRLIAEMADTPTGLFSVVGQALLGAGTIVVTGVPAGQTRSFRFVALDTLGNRSTPSGVVEETAEANPGGGSGITMSDQPASGPGNEGDLWFQLIDGEIVGQWGYEDGAWRAQLFSNEVIANLDAGKIQTGTLGAGTVAATSIEAGALNSFLIVGGNIQTEAAPNRGVNINSSGLSAYSSTGVPTFTINSATGAVSAIGDFQSGSGNSVFKATPLGIQLGNATFANAPFSVTAAGQLKATNATISGTINATGGTISGDIGVTGSLRGGRYITSPVTGGGLRAVLRETHLQFLVDPDNSPGAFMGVIGSPDDPPLNPGTSVVIASGSSGARLRVGPSLTSYSSMPYASVSIPNDANAGFAAPKIATSSLEVSGTTSSGTLTVTGNTTLGATTASSLTATGNVTAQDFRTPDGISIVNGSPLTFSPAAGITVQAIDIKQFGAFTVMRMSVTRSGAWSGITTVGTINGTAGMPGSVTPLPNVTSDANSAAASITQQGLIRTFGVTGTSTTTVHLSGIWTS